MRVLIIATLLALSASLSAEKETGLKARDWDDWDEVKRMDFDDWDDNMPGDFDDWDDWDETGDFDDWDETGDWDDWDETGDWDDWDETGDFDDIDDWSDFDDFDDFDDWDDSKGDFDEVHATQSAKATEELKLYSSQTPSSWWNWLLSF